MDSRISAIISKSLDGLMMRSMATAQNIANANSPNYRPLRVSFESELKAAAETSDFALQSIQFRAVQAPPASGSTAQRIDLELATASETALRYGALVDVLSRELQLQRTLIRGGQ